MTNRGPERCGGLGCFLWCKAWPLGGINPNNVDNVVEVAESMGCQKKGVLYKASSLAYHQSPPAAPEARPAPKPGTLQRPLDDFTFDA